jgi:hypothetical protein
MRLAIRNALLTGAAAALSIIGAAAAQAETVYVTESGAIASAPGYVYTTPQPAPLFGYPFGASQVIVTDPAPAVITEPSQAITPRERVITREVVAPREQVVAPREQVVRERIIRERVVTPQRSGAAPRERVVRERIIRERVPAPRDQVVVERERVISPPASVSDEVVVAPRESGIVTTGYSTSRSCFFDRNGFERCY